jgi:hypothetical protein
MGCRLTVVGGGEGEPARRFAQDVVLVGRAAGCDVVLAHPGVSRRHCRIRHEARRYVLEDAGSANGTGLNGERVVGRRVLRHGDVLSLGPVTLRFEVPADDAAGGGPAGETAGPSGRPERSPGTGRSRGSPVALRQARGARGRGRLWAAGVVLAVVTAGLGTVLALRRTGAAAGADRAEPELLGPRPLRDSFGVGEGVDIERPHGKDFRFEYTAATRALVVLHYQARDVGPGELVVSVNGEPVGAVPPDTPDSARRPLHQLVPSGLVRPGDNRVAFEPTREPPGSDPWRVWNVRVETVALPELAPAQLLAEAQAALRRGTRSREAAEVGARNRYDAWRAYREAWLLLEAHPEPRPPLYREARERMDEAQAQLDRLCAQLLLEAERHVQQHNVPAAAAALERVRHHYPGYDQPCPGLAEARRAEL